MKVKTSVLSATAVVAWAAFAQAQTRSLPPDIGGVNVLDFGATPDDATDDTAAIQAALTGDRTPPDPPDYYDPRPRLVFFPAGTYVVSDTLEWVGGALQLQGTGRTTVIKLADGAPGFGDPSQRKPVLQTMGGNYSFKEHIFDLVVDTGSNNPGAVGIDWIANNIGALRNLEIRSGDGQGVAGIDMTRQWPGPALVRGVVVDGFDYGIDVAHAEYGLVFEDVTLRNQAVAGLHNDGNVLSMRHLTTENVPLAFDNTASHGMLLLLDSQLDGTGAVAIRNEGQVYLRHVSTTGFDHLLDEAGAAQPGTSVTDEYLTGTIQQLFPSPQRSLNLPIEELPTYPDGPLRDWALADCAYQGCEGVLQGVLDSGKPIVYFKHGVRLIGGGTFRVPPSVKRVIGFGTHVNGYDDYGLTFEIADAAPDPVIFEHFHGAFKLVHGSARTVVVKSCQIGGYEARPGAGDLFLDDIGWTTDQALTPAAGQRVWAWQLNIEGDELHIDNAGASVWVFGLKSERRGTIARTTAGGYTEFLGTLLYGTMSWDSDPSYQSAFINDESSHSIVFAMSSYVDNGFYPYLVDETRGGENRKLPNSALEGRFMPLFVGYEASPSGSGGTGGATSCAGALSACGALCVDTDTDTSHCGACNAPCGVGEVCVAGSCGCGDSGTACGGACVDLSTDPRHCGACGAACGPNQTCAAGACQCGDGRVVCDGVCVDLLSSGQSCGACGAACDADLVCSAGTCSDRCADGLTQCGQDCATLATALDHCGACGHACALANAIARCTTGTCAVESCYPDTADLDGDPENGCECVATSAETCNGRDDDCDGTVDDGLDCGDASAEEPDGGCGCRTAQGERRGAALLAALALLTLAGRRRARQPPAPTARA